jgi:SecD/SecF fusion protein
LYYISFTVVSSRYNKKAGEYAAQKAENYKLQAGDNYEYTQYNEIKNAQTIHFLDSLANTKVWLGSTLKQCREKELSLGLDLKGGMNVTLEVSVPDILRALSDYNTTPNFEEALKRASALQKSNSNTHYLDLFAQAYRDIDPNGQLAAIFSTFDMKEKILLTSKNEEVLTVLKAEVESAIENSFIVLSKRIDRFGVVQPNIQKIGTTGRILIELPGVKEPERVRNLLKGSANLEFWETYNINEVYAGIFEANNILASLTAADTPSEQSAEEQTVAVDTVAVDTAAIVDAATDVREPVEEAIAEAETSSVDSLRSLLSETQGEDIDNIVDRELFNKQNPLFAVLSPNVNELGQPGRGPVIGYAQAKDTALINSYFQMPQIRDILPMNLNLMWTVKPISDNSPFYELLAIRMPSAAEKRAPLTGDAVRSAAAEFGQYSSNAKVSMVMSTEGGKTWARLTRDNIGKCIAIVLDGYVYSYPVVQNEITGGRSEISGTFSIEEATDLANILESGKMPAPARIVQENIVGPSLGQEAIRSGLISFIIAFCFILLYMIFYYGLMPGLIADLALFVNIFFLFGILISFSAVLTLPGIAGIVLTLGMAVDANVLIYERIREEMRAGKTMKRAIQDGFSNAISAIIDANVTTLITGIVLAVFGTGPVRGFAVILIIGIITSFLTAVFLTRYVLEAYANREQAKELPFTTNFTKNWFQNLKIDFIGSRKIAYIISGTLIVISIASFFTRGFSLGVDFSGGRNYIVRFEHPVNTEDVRELLADAFEGDPAQVITIGTDNQVRVTTKYKIDNESETADNEVESILFEHLKPVINNETVTKDLFVEGYVLDNSGNANYADGGNFEFGIQSSEKVGPTIADNIKRSAIWAVIIAIFAIGLYIFIRFRELGYSVGAVVSLAHNTLITMGLYSLMYGIMPFSMEIDQSFIAAILTVIGYSINDTVVIFDRIREYIHLYPKRKRKDVMNQAINATLSRTFSTSFSTVMVLVMIFIFGTDSIRGFVFAMFFGILAGTYSSLFVASPVSYELYRKLSKKGEEEDAPNVPEKKK